MALIIMIVASMDSKVGDSTPLILAGPSGPHLTNLKLNGHKICLYTKKLALWGKPILEEDGKTDKLYKDVSMGNAESFMVVKQGDECKKMMK